MSFQSHGRVYLVVALFAALFVYFSFGRGYSPISRWKSNLGFRNDISNRTLGFEKVLVINAPWRSDRKDSISLAASYSGIALDWINGINGSHMNPKAYPPGNYRDATMGGLGSWRAHMDAMREIIEKNLTTALVLEDDADWDFRIREQLPFFASAARRVPELALEALRHPAVLAELTPDITERAKRSSLPLPSLDHRDHRPNDPYGQNWDILWLGHCGADLPPASPSHPDRLTLSNDPTVAAPKHLRPTSHAPQDPLATLYPPQTRLYHRTSNSTLCTLAYAVTQAGARKILYQFGVRGFSKGYDFALSDYCAGIGRDIVGDDAIDEEGGIRRPMCVTVQPPLFSHYWSERGSSDIMGTGAGGRESGTRYVRKSVRGNIEALVKGEEEIEEQWVG